jgi:hypothetical protein
VSPGDLQEWVEVVTGAGKYANYDENALREKQRKNPIRIGTKE